MCGGGGRFLHSRNVRGDRPTERATEQATVASADDAVLNCKSLPPPTPRGTLRCTVFSSKRVAWRTLLPFSPTLQRFHPRGWRQGARSRELTFQATDLCGTCSSARFLSAPSSIPSLIQCTPRVSLAPPRTRELLPHRLRSPNQQSMNDGARSLLS